MSIENPTNLTLEAAQKILKSFSCTLPKTIESAEEKENLRQALLLFTSLSDYQNFGICALSAREGMQALKTYLNALGYEFLDQNPDLNAIDGKVYIKYNSKKGSAYLDSYTGDYRGVLVSCQSAEHDLVNGIYGHLPLDLFD
jgi:Domain of unknown function (DUF1824)